ncbi:SDR family NAD(P)-dependent oxidoreductase [Kurthia populi]|uniref:SDR family NAD(P)-dependent oxidoreductase n=1 Tax=Kurthia populi TaxID=1562132 RepID=A0ABW5Y6S1_9BACL
MNIEQKVAIVTGAASGLGFATAKMLADNGAVVQIFDVNEENGQKAATEIGGTFHKVDVTSEEQVQQAIDAIMAKHGYLDIAVNCAGIGPPAKVFGRKGVMSLDFFKKIIDINLIGTFNVLRLAVEQMAKNEPTDEHPDRGIVINTASIAAFDGQMGQAAYSASKGAIASMALPIARDLASLNIRINTIAPGLFETPLMQGMPENALASLRQIPEYPKRLGDPSEYAFTVKYMIESAYLNAELIRLDAATRMPAK